MPEKKIKVSIGLPVYNGENFIVDAIESILNQTFSDFELIISDNASTDATEAICRKYCSQDNRVKYYRNSENLGASANYIRVFNLAKGQYFKWAAHDDICLSNFLANCVEALDRDTSVVLAFTKVRVIDNQGKSLKEWSADPDGYSGSIPERFKALLSPSEDFQIWGLVRSEILAKTPLLGPYPGHARPLLTELSLYGKFHETPETLMLIREHSGRSVRAYDYRKPHETMEWYAPKMVDKLVFPKWRLLQEHINSINRPKIDFKTRISCYFSMFTWAKQHRHELFKDLVIAATRIPRIGLKIQKIYLMLLSSMWNRRVKKMSEKIAALIPRQDRFILVDELVFDPQLFSQWKIFPFIERDGQYWGVPSDDEEAISELERLNSKGTKYIVFAWPTFWWLEHFKKFSDHLYHNFPCVKHDKDVICFQLDGKK